MLTMNQEPQTAATIPTDQPTAQDITQALAYCTGTEQWYRHPLCPALTYTDGVKTFADMAGAYWFLDIVATEIFPLSQREAFLSVTLAVNADTTATITTDDGNGNVLHTRELEFTDCPAGDWRFYVTNRVLLIPSEY